MNARIKLRTLTPFLLLPSLFAGCSSSSSDADSTVGAGGAVAGAGGGTVGGVGGSTGGTTTGQVGGAHSAGGGDTAAGGTATGGGDTAAGGMDDAGSGGMNDAGSGGMDNAGSGGETGTDPGDAFFKDWPDGADPATIGERLAQVFLDEDISPDPKHYKVACAWYGSLAVSGILGNQSMIDSLIAKYTPYKDSYAELLSGQGHVDENVFGIVPLELSMHSDDASYLPEGLAIADHQQANINTQKRFAIDDMFMITALQVQAYRASEDGTYLDFTASVMVEYLDRLQQDDGLFHHHEDFYHKWARGNGWFAAGMAELIRELPETNSDYAAIRAGYEKMMTGLLGYQNQDGDGAGLWNQIVDSDDDRNWPETSGSAMFTYALVSGVRRGWLDADTYGPAARAGWLALVGKIGSNGLIQDISDWAYKPASHEGGPTYAGDEENYYFDRPKLTGDNHGQAPVMWTAAALAR